MKRKEMIVDLSKPPDERWQELAKYKRGFNALIDFFSGEILELVPSKYLEMLKLYTENYLTKEYEEELQSISKIMDMPFQKVAVGNLYYDVLKIVLGCSSFSSNTTKGPVHGRNLDWHSNDNDLRKHSIITRFINGKNEYISMGWPGFTGCLSGMAIGKFSITLNSVWSSDDFIMEKPIVYLIRQVLEKATCFDEAIALLSCTPIASDCLLMVCGTKPSEMAVVERTPTRGKIRYSLSGRILVTNDYKILDAEDKPISTELHVTSCGRYNRMDTLLHRQQNLTKRKVKRILNDPWVKMGITMQQMYFNPKKGTYKLY